MKRTMKAVSLLAVVAFLVMALVPVTALAADPNYFSAPAFAASDYGARGMFFTDAADATTPADNLYRVPLGGNAITDVTYTPGQDAMTASSTSATANWMLFKGYYANSNTMPAPEANVLAGVANGSAPFGDFLSSWTGTQENYESAAFSSAVKASLSWIQSASKIPSDLMVNGIYDGTTLSGSPGSFSNTAPVAGGAVSIDGTASAIVVPAQREGAAGGCFITVPFTPAFAEQSSIDPNAPTGTVYYGVVDQVQHASSGIVVNSSGTAGGTPYATLKPGGAYHILYIYRITVQQPTMSATNATLTAGQEGTITATVSAVSADVAENVAAGLNQWTLTSVADGAPQGPIPVTVKETSGNQVTLTVPADAFPTVSPAGGWGYSLTASNTTAGTTVSAAVQITVNRDPNFVPTTVSSAAISVDGPAVGTAPMDVTLSDGQVKLLTENGSTVPSTAYDAVLLGWLDASGDEVHDATTIEVGGSYKPVFYISLTSSDYVFSDDPSAAVNGTETDEAYVSTSGNLTNLMVVGPEMTAGAASTPTLPPVTTPSTPAAAAPIAPAPTAAPSAAASATAGPSESVQPSQSASAEPSASESAAPSESPSSSPSAEPSGVPSASAPVELKPDAEASDAPTDLKVEDNPDSSGSILTGVSIGTDEDTYNVENLSSWIAAPEGGKVEIVKPDGTIAEPAAPIATGMVIAVYAEDGTLLQTTTVVVKGDVTGSGEMNLTQLVNLAQAFTGSKPLTGVYELAADLDGNGEINLTDLVMEAQMFKDAGLTMSK